MEQVRKRDSLTFLISKVQVLLIDIILIRVVKKEVILHLLSLYTIIPLVNDLTLGRRKSTHHEQRQSTP